MNNAVDVVAPQGSAGARAAAHQVNDEPRLNSDFGQTGRNRASAALLTYGPVLMLLGMAAGLTGPDFGGDTLDYAASIRDFAQGRVESFYDFGHLLWRPLGWLAFRLSQPLAERFGGAWADPVSGLLLVNYLAALACVVLLQGLLRRLGIRAWIATLGTAAFLSTHAFLNYLHNGTSYLAGLSFLLLAAWAICREQWDRPRATAVIAGLASSLAVCFWFPYVLSIPAVLLMPLVFFGWNKRRVAVLLWSGLLAAVLTIIAYGLVAVHLGIHDIAGFRTWMATSAHSLAHLGTVPKVAFGFVRSWLVMGDAGLLFKRYLLRDPYNPVSVADLIGLSSAKIVLFYLFQVWLLLRLRLSRGGLRTLVFLILSAAPVFAFALYWEAGQAERYLAALPAFAIALAVAFQEADGSTPGRQYFRVVALVFVLLVALINGRSLYRGTLAEEQRAARADLDEVLPRLAPAGRLVVQPRRDVVLKRDYFIPSPYLRHFYLLLEPGNQHVTLWPREFALMTLSTWQAGGDVWVTKCFLGSRPTLDCNWIEGDDRRVSWTDVRTFFAQLQFGNSVGRDNGFVQVLQNEANLRVLNEVAGPHDAVIRWQRRLW